MQPQHHGQTDEGRCAAAEAIVQRCGVPIFGVAGSPFASNDGGTIEPGPLVWRQPLESYRDSIKEHGRSIREIAPGAGVRASPTAAVTYLRVGGSHKAGDIDKPLVPDGEPAPGDCTLRFYCGQSKTAAERKHGKGGMRPQGERGSKQQRRGALTAYDCNARFVLKLRNTFSRLTKCSLCRAEVRYSHSAGPDPEPFPMSLNDDGTCPWATGHGGRVHTIRAGYRLTDAMTLHCGHFLTRQPRLEHRVAPSVAAAIAAARSNHQVPPATLASMFAQQTGGMLSSKEMNRVIHKTSGRAGKDEGVSGLLDQLRRNGAAYVVKWRMVDEALVKENYGVDAGGADTRFELCLVSSAGTPTYWDVTQLVRTPTGSAGWCVADFFRTGQQPDAVAGVVPATALAIPQGCAMNAAMVYWQTPGQTAAAQRCMGVAITDTTCKTNSTVMEYGVIMGLTARLKTIHQGHYALNGLTVANYTAVLGLYRLFMGADAVGRVHYLGTDGDPQLIAAIASSLAPGGYLCVGGAKTHGLCRFHAVNISLMKLAAKHGFTAAERDAARDLQDRIHAMFRSCETTSELDAEHSNMMKSIREGTVAEGPTRRRCSEARAQGSVNARRTGAPANRKRFEVQHFIKADDATGEIEVKWRSYALTTKEKAERLQRDLGKDAFGAFCRAAGITTGGHSIGGHAGSAGDEASGGIDTVWEVERFLEHAGAKQHEKIRVKWLGFEEPTEEPAAVLAEDLGAAQFQAFCNAAGIAVEELRGLASGRPARVATPVGAILLEWYVDEIWPKRMKLAWCHRRGCFHLGADTTGAAENNFLLKHRCGKLNDKAPIRNIAEATSFQEKRRLANLEAERDVEFATQPPEVPGVPGRLPREWTRACLRLLARGAAAAGLSADAAYHIWPVAPQSNSGATAAWVVRRAGPRAGGGCHRIRVVHVLSGKMICTCWTWEVRAVECRHCLAIHGSVANSSAAAHWRRGTDIGCNDEIILKSKGRARGPAARPPVFHTAQGQAPEAPAWQVKIYAGHAELSGAAPGPPSIAPRPPRSAPAAAGAATAAAAGNHHIAEKAAMDATALVSLARAASTKPEHAVLISAGLAALRKEAEQLAAESARPHAPAAHPLSGVPIFSDMRQSRPGQGSFARGQGAYG